MVNYLEWNFADSRVCERREGELPVTVQGLTSNRGVVIPLWSLCTGFKVPRLTCRITSSCDFHIPECFRQLRDFHRKV